MEIQKVGIQPSAPVCRQAESAADVLYLRQFCDKIFRRVRYFDICDNSRCVCRRKQPIFSFHPPVRDGMFHKAGAFFKMVIQHPMQRLQLRAGFPGHFKKGKALTGWRLYRSHKSDSIDAPQAKAILEKSLFRFPVRDI